MNVSGDLSILSLVTQATLVVQIVMALLLLISLASWTSIFSKTLAIRRARRETEAFERRFWSGSDLNNLYQTATNSHHKTVALERIFEAGMGEFLKLRGSRGTDVDRQALLEGAQRAASNRLRRISGETGLSAKARGLQRSRINSCTGNSVAAVFCMLFFSLPFAVRCI